MEKDKATRTNCKTVVCVHTNVKDRDVIDMVKEVAKKTKIENIILTKTEDYSSSPPAHEREEGVIWFTDLIEKYPPNPPKVDINPKKDPCLLFFTGGTTGRPKGVMLSHYNVTSCTRSSFGSNMPQSVLRLIDGFFTQVIPLPICHVYGHDFYRFGFYLGSTILTQTDPRDTKEFVRLAKKYHPVFTPASPTQYTRLVLEEGADDLGLLAMTGSTPTAPKTQEDFEKKARSVVFESLGMTGTTEATFTPTVMDTVAPMLGGRETASKVFHLLDRILNVPGVVPLLRMGMGLIGRQNLGAIVSRSMPLLSSILPAATDKKRELTGTCGYPLVDEEVKIIDEDTGETIPIPKLVKEKLRGEICLKGPNLMIGYWPDRGSGVDDEGYIHSGDVVTVDEAGRLSVVDRTKDMVNVSGYKVYTIELDDLLYEYPGVYEAATIGVPDPERPGSERVKCFVTPLPEYKGKLKEEDIIGFLRDRVAKYAVPKSVEIRDEELPKTVAEKIFKKKLRDEEIEKMKKEGVLK